MIRLLLASILVSALQQPLFRTGVEAVRIDVSVMNGVNPVMGLTAADFGITDNGVAQSVASVSLDTVPLNLMLLLDVSASVSGDPLKDLIDAGHGLVKALRPDDRAALMTFSEPIRLTVPTSLQRDALIRELDLLNANGATSLYDAVFLALQLRPEETDSRPVLLVFSDGQDTSSWLNGSQLLEAVRRSGVVIHVVELTSSVARPNRFVFDLASAGGGRRWSATSSRDLRSLFGRVLNELRTRYLLTYHPTGVQSEGWHDLKVSLKHARGEVTARPGYFVAPK